MAMHVLINILFILPVGPDIIKVNACWNTAPCFPLSLFLCIIASSAYGGGSEKARIPCDGGGGAA